MKSLIVLGINDTHTATACLLKDGQIKRCLSEERLNRIKNYYGFPFLAAKKIMELENISGKDIDKVVFGIKSLSTDVKALQETGIDKRMSSRIFSKMAGHIPESINSSDIFIRNYVSFANSLKRKRVEKGEYKKYFDMLGLSIDKVEYCEHHLAHAMASYFFSPWAGTNNKTLVITNDGVGDGLCASVSMAQGNTLERIISIPALHSIGDFYSKVTSFMGFKPLEHEYKVMGLAPYVNPLYGDSAYRNTFESIFSIDPKNPLRFKNNTGLWGNAWAKYLQSKLFRVRFDSVAYSIQKLIEEVLTQWIDNLCRYFDIHNIAVGGGTFMNIKANKKILELESVDNMFVFPSAGDESTAIGAAVKEYVDLCIKNNITPVIKKLGPIYFGPSYAEETEDFVKKISGTKYTISHYQNIEEIIADMLSKGKIIARFKGNMEYGARGLGNRSLLADPRNPDIIKIINRQIKARDFWMPFAPTILKERAEDYIINPKKIEAPYMTFAFDTTKNVKEIIASVHPADGTVRPQILEKEWNPDYYKLIKTFEEITGVGGILNTSFNRHGYPIDCMPHHALETLENTELQHLAVGDYLISKK